MDKREDVILVTGATGKQGGALARHLLAKGYRVYALTRKPEGEAARELAALGAKIVYGNFDDPLSMEKALSGVWGVFSMQNTWEAGVQSEEEQGKRIATLAKEAGVQQFVYTSVGSSHRQTGIPHFDNKWRIEETIRGIGFRSYTILRPVFFMENFLSPWFKPALDAEKLTVGILPETRLQMIAVNDIGKFGLLAFEKHDQLNGRNIDIAGDELTMPQAAEILSAATGKKIVFEPTPIDEIRKFSEDFAIMLEWFDRVGYEADVEGLQKEFGFHLTTLAEWARRASWT